MLSQMMAILGEKEVFSMVFHIIFSDKANMEMGEKMNFLYEWGEEHPWTSPGVSDMVAIYPGKASGWLASLDDRDQRFRSDRDVQQCENEVMDICQ